jgi:tetratricopeptide (TPR) repeat protein
MRILLLALLSVITLQALSLKINSGRYDKSPYSILHLTHQEPFSCVAKKTMRDKVYEYVCEVEGVALNRFATSQSRFFRISSDTKDKVFSIRIEAKEDIALYPIEYDLKASPEVEWHKDIKSKHWVFVGFLGKLPVITDKKKSKGLSFPLEMTGTSKPYIGALDLNKNPLHFDSSDDVKTFLDVKQIYEDEKFEDVVELIDEYLEKNPESIFESDFVLYKIKALSAMNTEDSSEKNIKLTEEWIKSYPSNENIPEVLVHSGKAYSRMRQEDHAKKIFDTVIEQHPKTKYAALAKLYLGDINYHDTTMANGEAVAERLYVDALYSTKDIEVASMAAMRLGKVSVTDDKLKSADEYYRKVLDSNKEHMIKDPKAAYALAKRLRLKKMYALSADIGAAILPNLTRTHEIYETLLHDTAAWYAKAQDVPNAIKYYQLYLKRFPNSDFSVSARRELDMLVFKQENPDNEELLAKYDKLIDEYKDQDIARKATYHKAELLKSMGRYDDALALEDELMRIPESEAPNKEALVHEIATLLAKKSLDTECFKAVTLIKKYDVKLEEEFDKKVYNCYYQSYSYQDAIDISKKYINDKDLATKLDWLYNTEKALFKKGSYNEVLTISKDILELSDMLKTKQYDDVYYDLFDVHVRLNETDKLVSIVNKIEKSYPMDLKNIKVYKKMIILSQRASDSFMVIDYARKLIAIQKRFNLTQESPWVETVAIETYISLNRLESALSIAKEALDNSKLSDDDRAKLLYSQAKVYQRMGNIPKQKITLEECSSISSMSQWVNLCKEALKWSE